MKYINRQNNHGCSSSYMNIPINRTLYIFYQPGQCSNPASSALKLSTLTWNCLLPATSHYVHPLIWFNIVLYWAMWSENQHERVQWKFSYVCYNDHCDSWYLYIILGTMVSIWTLRMPYYFYYVSLSCKYTLHMI